MDKTIDKNLLEVQLINLSRNCSEDTFAASSNALAAIDNNDDQALYNALRVVAQDAVAFGIYL